MFGRGTRDIETGVNRLYRAFKTTAERCHYTFQRPEITVGGRPSAVFLGNHSSGKSTVVNHLLGDPPVQDTGVAPTDDCFTVILYGAVEQDYYGPAAVGQLPAEFANIAAMLEDAFGGSVVVKPDSPDAPAASDGEGTD